MTSYEYTCNILRNNTYCGIRIKTTKQLDENETILHSRNSSKTHLKQRKNQYL